MAIARPVRALGLAAIVMWIFFLWQMFSPSAPIRKPGDDYNGIYERDPNLDRECLRSHRRIPPYRMLTNKRSDGRT